jgi:hypothetical protein
VDVLGAVAVGLFGVDAQPVRRRLDQGAVHAHPAPGGEVDRDRADGLSRGQFGEWVTGPGRRGDVERGVVAVQEARGPDQRGTPQQAVGVPPGEHRERLTCEELVGTTVEVRFGEHPDEASRRLGRTRLGLHCQFTLVEPDHSSS